MQLRTLFTGTLAVIATAASALTVTVAPTSGTSGQLVTDTIADAISQVNAGSDVDNSILLRSTEGIHTLPAADTWAFTAGKNVTISAESGQPIVKLQYSGTAAGDMLIIEAGTNASAQTETITYNDIAFIPQTGISYGNNVADGINIVSGNHHFNNCVFSFNDGSDAVGSQEGDVAWVNGGNVGDDWIEFGSFNNLTFSHCTITGAADDAIVVVGNTNPALTTIRLENGTCIANNGGGAFQNARPNTAFISDGESGRIIMADNGKRPSTNDTGPKFFWDVGCSIVINKTDILSHNNGGLFDFEGVPTITITNSRIAFNNSDSITDGGNIAIWDTANDSATTLQAIVLDHVTVHDTPASGFPYSIVAKQAGDQPSQAYVITDSVFSGAGDDFSQMTNKVNSMSTIAVTNSAVVTAGSHAVADTGDLGTAMLGDDPVYESETYTIGRGLTNPSFLRPTAATYETAGTGGTFLRGGAPDVPSRVNNFMLY